MTVLIVDDDPVSRRLIRMTLERAKKSTAEVGSAEAALEWLKADASATLIIMDLDLPGRMKGAQFFSFLHSSQVWQKMPIIVCTSVADEASVKDAIQRGVRHYLVKPVQPALLMEKVEEIESRAVPILEQRFDTQARLGVSEAEYKYLVEDADAHLGELTQAYEAAKARDDIVDCIAIVKRFRSPAALLGAARLVDAVDELSSLLEDRDVSRQQRDASFTLVMQEVKVLQDQLAKLGRPGQATPARS